MRFTEADLEAYRVRRAQQSGASSASVPGKLRARGKRGKMGPSALELLFAEQLGLLKLPNPRREFQFMEDRKFRLDFAWPDVKTAVEVQGMVHRIKGRFSADIEKRALALLAGWRVLEVSGQEIRSGQAVAWLQQLLNARD